MVYDSLHENIKHQQWSELESTLSTSSGLEMAREPFKEDLPLHMCCRHPQIPLSVILSLLRAYPTAASIRGKNGSYPLHLASEFNGENVDILVVLIRAFPTALDELDDDMLRPRDYVDDDDDAGFSMSREVLRRPTACWMEDVEKEEYLERASRRRDVLKKKIVELECALEISKERRGRMKLILGELNERSERNTSMMEEMLRVEVMLDDFGVKTMNQIEVIQERAGRLSVELNRRPSDDEVMMKSLMKRSYMTSVQKQYEKLMNKMSLIRTNMEDVKIQFRKRERQQGRDDTEEDLSEAYIETREVGLDNCTPSLQDFDRK